MQGFLKLPETIEDVNLEQEAEVPRVWKFLYWSFKFEISLYFFAESNVYYDVNNK